MANLLAMNANEAMVARMGESATGGSLESGGWSYVGALLAGIWLQLP
jgi:hypothetical protein